MIKLHHLNKSRSKRIIWLLEELNVKYEVVPYQRDSVTFLAPPELKSVHPLGKSPVIEDDGLIIAESGAISEYLIDKYADGQLAPARGTKEYAEYSQWLHFAESSAILPLLLKMFVAKDGCETNFLADYADLETAKVIQFFDNSLAGKRYLVADQLTGADIMMSFIAEIVKNNGELDKYKNIAAYIEQLATHPAFIRADKIELDAQA
ncbi:glutathione S-transferase family protein [Psychromonas antarctica]|jgi:glutathione S-transferase|uniref:glutathione S-transferase family protein n=1 Tax=Psychromonas antarctica TaxID=67573 RepID=UPI001EE8AE35|nr:glutathione S-transferase [Psychromonas antarctica]MCG6201857.1 glutathione S-transferase [Psychromonas antarctica]